MKWDLEEGFGGMIWISRANNWEHLKKDAKGCSRTLKTIYIVSRVPQAASLYTHFKNDAPVILYADIGRGIFVFYLQLNFFFFKITPKCSQSTPDQRLKP